MTPEKWVDTIKANHRIKVICRVATKDLGLVQTVTWAIPHDTSNATTVAQA
jgi:hypothetical protein